MWRWMQCAAAGASCAYGPPPGDVDSFPCCLDAYGGPPDAKPADAQRTVDARPADAHPGVLDAYGLPPDAP